MLNLLEEPLISTSTHKLPNKNRIRLSGTVHESEVVIEC